MKLVRYYRWDKVPLFNTVKELAEMFGSSENSVLNLIHAGKLRASKCGKNYIITRDAVQDYFNVPYAARETAASW